MDSMCQQQCTWPQRTQHCAGLSLGPPPELHSRTRAPQWSCWYVRSASGRRAPSTVCRYSSISNCKWESVAPQWSWCERSAPGRRPPSTGSSQSQSRLCASERPFGCLSIAFQTPFRLEPPMAMFCVTPLPAQPALPALCPPLPPAQPRIYIRSSSAVFDMPHCGQAQATANGQTYTTE